MDFMLIQWSDPHAPLGKVNQGFICSIQHDTIIMIKQRNNLHHNHEIITVSRSDDSFIRKDTKG